jgi:hypothetical protein
MIDFAKNLNTQIYFSQNFTKLAEEGNDIKKFKSLALDKKGLIVNNTCIGASPKEMLLL